MKKVFNKIIENLEKQADERYKAYCIGFNSDDRAEYYAYVNTIKIVKQEAEQYNNAIIDGKYCFQSCACTEKCNRCSRLCNGNTDWYENIDNWTEYDNHGDDEDWLNW